MLISLIGDVKTYVSSVEFLCVSFSCRYGEEVSAYSLNLCLNYHYGERCLPNNVKIKHEKKLTDKHTRKYKIKHNFYVTAAAGLQLANV